MTIVGHHTAAELRPLLAAKDFENAKMQAAYDGLSPVFRATLAVKEWLADWNAYKSRYAGARQNGMLALKASDLVASTISPKNYPTESEWVAVLQAEHQVSLVDKVLGNTADGEPYKKGDKQDLYNRLIVLRGDDARSLTPADAPTPPAVVSIDFTGIPQPPAGLDTDLNVYLAADAATKKIETVTDPTKSIWPWVAGAGLGLGLYIAWKIK